RSGDEGPAPAPASSEPAPAGTERFAKQGRVRFVKGASGNKIPVAFVAIPHRQVVSSATGNPPVGHPAYPLTNTRDYTQGPERDKLLSNLANFDPSHFENVGTD